MARPPRYSRYLTMLLAPIALGALVVASLALWMEPTANDLTRLGAYPERDYGWRSVQREFRPPLAAYAALGRPYDVVVFGDSFSIDGRTGPDEPRNADHGFWTDWFVQRTGLTVGTFHRDQVDLTAYLESAVFKANPPKLIVFEFVERVLARIQAGPPACEPVPPGPVFRPELHPVPAEPVAYNREPLRGLPITPVAEAVDFLAKNVPRWLLGLNTTKVRRVPLTRPDLFSNRRSSDLLVFIEDFEKPVATHERAGRLACFLHAFQARIEPNGRTAVVFMIAPDKAVTYQAVAPDLPPYNLTEAIARDRTLPLLRLDRALQQAIADGTQDVYIPGDTHWAEAGKRIAADTLIRYLQGER